MGISPRRFARIALTTLAAVALGDLLVRAVMEIRRGNAGGAFENAFGMQIQWIYPVIYASVLLVAFLVALAIRWWQGRDDRTIARLLKQKRARDPR